LAKVLVRLTHVKLISPPESLGDPTGDVMRSHEGIVDAITAHDRDLARLRLRKHLDAVSEWVR
jgi:DNA-binding FadR family transcriptional regulator